MHVCQLLLFATCIFARINATASTEEELTCPEGLHLHGVGQWGRALHVFTEVVSAKMRDLGPRSLTDDTEDVIDCFYGAGLSLNALGQYEASLASFRLAQRLQYLHPAGSGSLADQAQQRCKEFAVTATFFVFRHAINPS